MNILKTFTVPVRAYPGVQDEPFIHTPFLDMYRYHIIEENGEKYLADDTLLKQCAMAESERATTIPLYEDEISVQDAEEVENV